jgi:hypothetical protein
MRRLLFTLVLVAACSDSDPPLSDATSLQCPAPGRLPFRLSSDEFQKSNNEAIAADNPRIKDEASDTIGNPGGATASVYLANDQVPATGIDYRGVKARSTPANGILSKPLAGETVSLWTHDPAAATWKSLGKTTTDIDGSYDLPDTGHVAPNGQPVYAVLEADGSCAEHFDYLLPPGSEVVVTDIDGTLTIDDNQIIRQSTEAGYVPVMMAGGDRLTQAWAAKGYPIIYLTARGHYLRTESRGWLAQLGFAAGPLITTSGGTTGADVYKTLWLERMVQRFGWNIVAAYGNADTDITAYENAGIDKQRTFIVGPLAGTSGTQPIANMDFTAHIAGYVAIQPANP